MTISILLSFIALSAFAGQDRGGGDVCEDKIKIIKDDLSHWIKQGGSKGLIFSSGIKASQYDAGMLKEISKAKIRCVSQGDQGYPVEVYGTPKICRFDKKKFLDTTSITCSRDEFLKLSEDEQYTLIHHEYAGLGGFESPDRDDSQYNLSNQISSFLTYKTVRRLSVKVSPSVDGEWIRINGKEALDVYSAMSASFFSARFEDCDLEKVPLDETQYFNEYQCGDEKYISQLFHIKKRDSSKLGLTFMNLHFGCDPRVKNTSLFRNVSGKKIKFVIDHLATGDQLIESIYELDSTGHGISEANYSAIKLVRVNKGTIAIPNWIYEKETVTSFQCKSGL